MKELSVKGYYLPQPLQKEVVSVQHSVHEFPEQDTIINVEFPIVTPEFLQKVIAFLQDKKSYLEKKSVHEIADILDKASECWLDNRYPKKIFATEAISLFTGFSPEMVNESIRVEHLSSRKPDLLKALRSEIGNENYLDKFCFSEDLRGDSKAFGPALIAAIFSSNIPGLPHLSIMRSLLVKSPIVGKLSQEEPIFPPLYAETIREIDPVLGDCLAILSWRGGDETIEKLLFEQCGVVIVYGSEETCRSVSQRIPLGSKLISHSHKLGFGMVGREALNKKNLKNLARRIAYDVTMFDQFACISPQIYFLEQGGEVSPRDFVAHLGEEMTYWQKRIPPARLSVDVSGTLRHLRNTYELKELSGEDITMCASQDLSWSVVYEPLSEFVSSPLHRFIRIVPMRNLKEISHFARPIKQYLQNISLEVAMERREEMYNLLSSMGVSRIAPPGKMATPSMMWHHDGLACLGEMVRWTDIEMFETTD